MKSSFFKLLGLGVLGIWAFSCKKKDDPAPTPGKTKTVLITQSSWKTKSVKVDLDKNGTPDTDATSYFQACELDNIYTFKTNGSGLMDEGAAVCAPGDPQTKPFNWLFKTNETMLSANISAIKTGDATLVSINDNELVLNYDYPNGGTSYRLIVTLTH